MGIVMTQEMVLVNISHYKIAKCSAPLPLHGIVLALEIVKTLEMDLVSICQYKIAKCPAPLLQPGIVWALETVKILEMDLVSICQYKIAKIIVQLQLGIAMLKEIAMIQEQDKAYTLVLQGVKVSVL